jgi:hypothetical protein
MKMKRTPEVKAKFPPGFFKVRLRLAREPGHPEGSDLQGYDIVVPLNKDRRIDAEAWKKNRDLCRAVHYRDSEEHDVGHVVHLPGGVWTLRFDVRGDDEDAVGYRFSSERFVVGEYMSLREGEALHTYRVVGVEEL